MLFIVISDQIHLVTQNSIKCFVAYRNYLEKKSTGIDVTLENISKHDFVLEIERTKTTHTLTVLYNSIHYTMPNTLLV